MTVKAHKLVRMAQHIAANISISDDPDVVASELATHLKRFWDPRMLDEYQKHIGATDENVDAVLRKASEILGKDVTARDT